MLVRLIFNKTYRDRKIFSFILHTKKEEGKQKKIK